MDNLINETNTRLQEIIDNLTTIKTEYEGKLRRSSREIDVELEKVNKYKEEFFISKQKIEKMNADIEGFEQDYQNLVERFKDDELANILIAANKEISAKIDERKRKIAKDKISMNELIEKAELSKNKLVKITAEKKALELCLVKILDAYEFYTSALTRIINYTSENPSDLAKCFRSDAKQNIVNAINQISYKAKEEKVDFEEEEIQEIDEKAEVETEEIDKILEEAQEYTQDIGSYSALDEDDIEETDPNSKELVKEDVEKEEKVEPTLKKEDPKKEEVKKPEHKEEKQNENKNKNKNKKQPKVAEKNGENDFEKMFDFDDSLED